MSFPRLALPWPSACPPDRRLCAGGGDGRELWRRRRVLRRDRQEHDRSLRFHGLQEGLRLLARLPQREGLPGARGRPRPLRGRLRPARPGSRARTASPTRRRCTHRPMRRPRAGPPRPTRPGRPSAAYGRSGRGRSRCRGRSCAPPSPAVAPKASPEKSAKTRKAKAHAHAKPVKKASPGQVASVP